jgi:hypothetical protein
MAKRHDIKGGLEFAATWVEAVPALVPEIDETLCRLKITVGGRTATTFQTDHGRQGDSVEVPAYHLANWMAANWWALFHEPQKSEEEDYDYRARHWIGYARNGFALPNMWLQPTGGELNALVIPSRINSCRLSFTNDVESRVPIDEAKRAAKNFVDATIARLNAAKLTDTELHEAWRLVTSTGENVSFFCELVGALGLSPYDENPGIERAVDIAVETLGEKLTRELCEAATPQTIVALLDLVRTAFAKINESAPADFSSLPERPVLPNKAAHEAGERSARALRKELDLTADAESGETVLRRLGVDPNAAASVDNDAKDELEVQGAIARDGSAVRMALLKRPSPAPRRFAAARAVFLGWGATSGESRLMTSAHTREQQASRAFAAELLAPFEFIRHAAGRGPISDFRIKAIADELRVSPKVVRYQAINHHLPLAPA